MKASELMIGDWVRNALLDEVFKMNTTSMRNMCWDEDNRTARYKIEPIPLTEEILKANGFHYEEEFCEWWINGCPFHIMLGCDFDGDCAWVSSEINPEIPLLLIKYVHTLQHALRLCGLNEFADNFKVTNQTRTLP